MSISILSWPEQGRRRAVERFMARPAFNDDAEAAARKVLAAIKAEGNRAVSRYAREFDGVSLRAADLAIKPSELREARASVDARCRAAVGEAHARITAFAEAGMKKDWTMPTPAGGTLGEKFTPLSRVGVYVPGGAAPLVSTALMTVTLARVAGVREIAACTPCDSRRRVNPVLLYALEQAGCTEIYRVGGIQAVGLMAYGTRTVRRVDKIVGPGGTYVTAAKRQVYGQVALDLVAGPSEIAILADESADARFVAADLLSQAEHGSGHEKALCVTPCRDLAEAVACEVECRAKGLSRQQQVKQVMRRGMRIVVVKTLDDGMALCNRFAAEHLELMVRRPKLWLNKVRHAGAVFLGPWSPECVGDFVAGPSHVLPTGGAATMFSGLTVDDFRKRSSHIAFTRADLKETLPAIETFGAVEGLDAHAQSARVRFDRQT